MSQLVRVFILFLISINPSILLCKIIETDKISDLLSEVDVNTLVVFDIDDTLITTKSLLGSTASWTYLANKVKCADLKMDREDFPLNALIESIIRQAPIKTLECDTVDLILGLQEKEIDVIALTARKKHPFYLKTADVETYQSLKNINIDFYKKPFVFKDRPLDAFSKGIIYTDYQLKGPFLKRFLETIENKPSKIIFIDDQLYHVKSVEETVEGLSIPFVGYHYTYPEKNYPTFDPLLLNIQLEKMVMEGVILSDAEALEIKNKGCYPNPHYFMDSLIEKCK